MQQAVPVGEGAMAALLGLDLAAASEIAARAAGEQVCEAANDNDPSQVVISGHREAVERAIELAREAGAKRAVLLPVSAPFHCALMQPAAESMRAALAETEIAVPSAPVISNVTAEPETDPERISQLLVEQVTGTVRWRESVARMSASGIDEIWEIGAGKALSGMVRRIDRAISTRQVGTAEEARAALN